MNQITKVVSTQYPISSMMSSMSTKTTSLINEILLGIHLDCRNFILNTGHIISSDNIVQLNIKEIISSSIFNLHQQAANPADVVRALLGI